MNTWKLDLDNWKGFVDKYTRDFKYILKGVEDIPIDELIDTYDIKSKKTILCEGDLKNRLLLGKGVFLLLGIVADEEVNYFRFLNHIQYRIGDGEFYEHSGENFHLYKCDETKLNLGEIKPWVEMSLGIMLELDGAEIKIKIGEIKDNNVITIENAGDIERLFNKWFKYNY